MLKHQEHILAMPASTFHPEGEWAPLLGADVIIAQRAKLEADPSNRQLITYATVRCGDRYALYERLPAGNEAGLHGQLSIGWGWHTDLVDLVFDSDTGVLDLDATLARAARRKLEKELELLGKLEEELELLGDNRIDRIREVEWHIIFNANAVDAVHAGIPMDVVVATEAISTRDPAIRFLGFKSLQELAGLERLESWSQLLVDLLLARTAKV
ncbi:hypothetical protein [Marinobacterium sp. BA1]|uniref:hypothetical protein n=1 Tax=Marinobacterium sp. BA1 TaxID=3138931 RepID=UPI0032E58B47